MFIFLYVVAITISLVLEHSRHEHVIGAALMNIMNVPLLLLDGILFYWIFSAYRRTLNHLSKKNQVYKYNIVNRMFLSFVTCLGLALLVMFIELLTQRKGFNRDYYWKSDALWEKLNFIITTIYTICLMVILKPAENSHQL